MKAIITNIHVENCSNIEAEHISIWLNKKSIKNKIFSHIVPPNCFMQDSRYNIPIKFDTKKDKIIVSKNSKSLILILGYYSKDSKQPSHSKYATLYKREAIK